METAKDTEIWALAKNTGAVIITKDDDFARLAKLNPNGPRVIWLRVGNSAKQQFLTWIDRAWPAAIEALDRDEQVIEIAPRGGTGDWTDESRRC